MAQLSSKARPESDCSTASRRGNSEFTKADATDVSAFPAAFKERPAGGKTGQHRKRNEAGPKAWPEKGVMGGRAKAENFKTRAQAGAMLRLSRVMKNR